MPFKSEAQRRFMYAKHPEMAKRWEKHTSKGKKLPEKVDESTNVEMNRIIELLEDIGSSGGTSHMTGGSAAQVAMMVQPDVTTLISDPHAGGYCDSTEPEEPEFTELELKLARRFIELVGGAERARDLVNKCDECAECLGLVDDTDTDTIESMAAVIPSDVDLPTPRGVDISTLYNPNAIAGPFGQ